MHSEKVRQTRAHDELGVVQLSRAVQLQHFSHVAVEGNRQGEREGERERRRGSKRGRERVREGESERGRDGGRGDGGGRKREVGVRKEKGKDVK